jgi:hypothetical protein
VRDRIQDCTRANPLGVAVARRARYTYDWTQNVWDRRRASRQRGLLLARFGLLLAGVIAFVVVIAWAFRP